MKILTEVKQQVEAGEPKWYRFMLKYGPIRKKAGLPRDCAGCGQDIEGLACCAGEVPGHGNLAFCEMCSEQSGHDGLFKCLMDGLCDQKEAQQ